MSVYESHTNYNTPEPTLRKVSSVVLSEKYLDDEPRREQVKYIEVPVIEERIRQLPRREIIDVEKRIPKIEYQYVDRTVEVPHIQYQDRTIEVPQIQEEVRYVTKHEYVDRQVEVIERVPRIETRVVEKIIDVPGQIVEVPKPYRVEQDVPIPQYNHHKRNVLVAQTLRPEFVPGEEVFPVEVMDYVPEYIEVEILVPKLVDLPIRSRGMVDQYYHSVNVPAGQWNSILKTLNPTLQQTDFSAVPFIYQNGALPELPMDESHRYMEINEDTIVRNRGLRPGGSAYYQHPLTSGYAFPRAGFPAYESFPQSQIISYASPPLFSQTRRDVLLARSTKSAAGTRRHRKKKH